MRPAPKRGALPTALWLLRSGFWPVPISARKDPHAGSPGKSPIGRAWGANAPARDGLMSTFARCPGAGVGIVLGPAAGVVDVEVDDPVAAAPILERVDPGETIGWHSARGEHRVYAWTERLAQLTEKSVVYLAGGALELRIGASGKQLAAVCPPTVGTDRRCRRWNGVWEIAPFPERLLEEIVGVRMENAPCRERALLIGTQLPYATAALDAESGLVRNAAPGSRNRTLNRAAFSLGQLVGAKLLERSAVEVTLSAAAELAGLEEREVAATLRSGLEAGIKKPRRHLPAG